jgi:hypothetical protein
MLSTVTVWISGIWLSWFCEIKFFTRQVALKNVEGHQKSLEKFVDLAVPEPGLGYLCCAEVFEEPLMGALAWSAQS